MSIYIDGLMSGLDTTSIINELLSLKRKPIEQLIYKTKLAEGKKDAYLEINSRLLELRSRAVQLSDQDKLFQSSITSSNPDILTAGGIPVADTGTYNFLVGRLAQNEQRVSSGFASASEVGLPTGSLTIELGGGFLETPTRLSELNGGQGVYAGSVRITDRSGASATIDLSMAVDTDDVISAINNSGVAVIASTQGGTFVINDVSGGGGALSVQEVGAGTTANDLGIAKSVASNTLAGDVVRTVSADTMLDELNDGRGIRQGIGDDIRIDHELGFFDVDISTAVTLGDVVDLINSDPGNGGQVLAEIGARGIKLTDNFYAAGPFQVLSLGGSNTALDLGIAQPVSAPVINGEDIISGLDSSLLSSLRGGLGIGRGTIDITDRSGATDTVDLSNAQTIDDIISLINAGAVSVTASINSSGDGILLTDTSGGAGAFIVVDNSATAAADLGINTGAPGVNQDLIDSDDLNIQYISRSTRLDSLRGGKGVQPGKIRLTDGAGNTSVVDLSQADDTTIADVIDEINAVATNIVASINTAGNGILLTDTTGSGMMTIADEEGGRTARDLNIAGSSSSGTLDGSFELTVDIDASDTLESVREKINNLNIPVTATIFSDGTSTNPYHLAISGDVAGSQARVMVNGSDAGIDFSLASAAKDAAIRYGDGSSGSMLITKSSNVITDLVEGLTITLKGTSDTPVSVSVAQDLSQASGYVQEFVDKFNELMEILEKLSVFDIDPAKRGILMGEGTIRRIKQQLFQVLSMPSNDTGGSYSLASQVGIRADSNGRLTFDISKFSEALENDSEGVMLLFTAMRKLDVTTRLEDFGDGEGVDIVSGLSDFRVTRKDGVQLDVDLTGAVSLVQVLNRINNHANNADGKLVVGISADGMRLELADTTGGGGNLSVTSLNNSGAFSDLGIAMTTSGSRITGREIILTDAPGLGNRLVSDLDFLTDVEEGSITLRTNSLDSDVERYEDTIERYEARLVREEERLRRQFTLLEQVIGDSQNTMNWLNNSLTTMSSALMNG
ncbi:MAG: flagellar filament capping protein FliD [Planctomycetota bacterium]|jgi:flagellar hook-associated protein 2